jgi:hypothetical protein
MTTTGRLAGNKEGRGGATAKACGRSAPRGVQARTGTINLAGVCLSKEVR